MDHQSSTRTITERLVEYEGILKANPSDFFTWEKYVTLIEMEADPMEQLNEATQRVLSVYSDFLKQFPLLFGYWKKYADAAFKITHDFKQVVDIYERAVDLKTGITNNPDLWSHYCIFVAEQSDNVDEIRKLFERAINTIGHDYYARILWEKYIEFESSQDEYGNVVKLYKRAIRVPSKDLTLIWSQFKDFMKVHTKQDTSENQENILQLEQFAETEEEKNAYLASNKLKDLTDYWREQLYLPTKKELDRIRPFEDQVRRPYFHVQPFQENEIDHIRKYLENEEAEFKNKNCSLDHIIQLYERVIVYCAYYMEIWNRYIRFLESQNMSEKIAEIYDRLINCSVLKERYFVHLQYAEYLEMKNENPESIYDQLINQRCVGHLESLMSTIAFYSRRSNFEKVEQIYSENIQKIQGDAAQCYFKIQFAQFMWKVRNNETKARELLNECVNEHKTLKKAYQSLLEFESECLIKNQQTPSHFDALVDKIVNLEYYNTIDDIKNNTDDVEKVVVQYMQMWGMPNPEAPDTNAMTDDIPKNTISVSLKIDILQILKRYAIQHCSIEKVKLIKDTLKKLDDEKYECQRKRRLGEGEGSSKKAKSDESTVQRWTTEQYKLYYQQFYQYYQQFTQI